MNVFLARSSLRRRKYVSTNNHLTMMAVGNLGSFMSEPDPPPETVLRAVEKAGGRVTVADVASGAGISLSEAKKQLTVLAQLARGDLEVSSDGELVYRFGTSFRSELLARSTKKQIQEVWDKVAPVTYYILRVSFGVALISSIALIFTAILVLQSSSKSDDDRDRRSGGYSGGFGGFGSTYMWGPSPFNFFYYNSYQPYGVNRYQDQEGVCVCVCVCVCVSERERGSEREHLYIYVYISGVCTHTHTHTHSRRNVLPRVGVFGALWRRRS
jgi:hypothetical protein